MPGILIIQNIKDKITHSRPQGVYSIILLLCSIIYKKSFEENAGHFLYEFTAVVSVTTFRKHPSERATLNVQGKSRIVLSCSVIACRKSSRSRNGQCVKQCILFLSSRTTKRSAETGTRYHKQRLQLHPHVSRRHSWPPCGGEGSSFQAM